MLYAACAYRFGSYLVIIFVVSKLLYIANAVSQFFILSRLLAFNYLSYGIDLLRGIPMDDDYAPYHVFPKVTYCDIGIRRLGFNQQYAVQCALPLNLLHERVYQVGVLTCGDAICVICVVTCRLADKHFYD